MLFFLISEYWNEQWNNLNLEIFHSHVDKPTFFYFSWTTSPKKLLLLPAIITMRHSSPFVLWFWKEGKKEKSNSSLWQMFLIYVCMCTFVCDLVCEKGFSWQQVSPSIILCLSIELICLLNIVSLLLVWQGHFIQSISPNIYLHTVLTVIFFFFLLSVFNVSCLFQIRNSRLEEQGIGLSRARGIRERVRLEIGVGIVKLVFKYKQLKTRGKKLFYIECWTNWKKFSIDLMLGVYLIN